MILRLGAEVDELDTDEISDFIFWVENVKMELASEHLLED